MIVKALSASYLGMHAYPVHVEVDVSNGLPQFIVVGLPDQGIKESRERVRAAIKNSGFEFPPDKITVNLAPADIKKEGPSFDLAIALGILCANSSIGGEHLSDYVLLGELALDGSLRPVKGALVMATGLSAHQRFIMPYPCAREAALEKKCRVYPAKNLKEVVGIITGTSQVNPMTIDDPLGLHHENSVGDFSEVKGQPFAKRGLEIAIAGGHNILLVGPPGSGKTMLAKRIPSILPPLNLNEAIELAKINSIHGYNHHPPSLTKTPPFRAPHYSCSPAALLGGGSIPKPGETSLAHRGILFLDEFAEFRRDVLEALRTPMEDQKITISRARMHITYPTAFTLVAAMNPCPCGYLTDRTKTCRCTLSQLQKYRMKLSGPILDRLDLHIDVTPVSYRYLQGNIESESSEIIRNRILQCRKIQHNRFSKKSRSLNATMSPRDIQTYATPNEAGRRLIAQAMKELKLSARAYYKILKVSRTIADLAGEESIGDGDVAEAMQFRNLDRH